MEAIGLVDGTLQKWIMSVNVEYIVWHCLVVPIHPDSDDLLTVWPPKLGLMNLLTFHNLMTFN